MGALQSVIQTDSGSYSSGPQLVILNIIGNWSCDHHPIIPLNECWPAESSLSWFSWVFGHTRSHFLLGLYVNDPDMDPKGSPSCVYTAFTNSIFLNFPLFFYSKDSNLLFWTCTLNLTRAIWKCANICKQDPNIVNNSYSDLHIVLHNQISWALFGCVATWHFWSCPKPWTQRRCRFPHPV